MGTLPGKQSYTDRVTLTASSAKTATGNGSACEIPGDINAVAFTLDLTAATTTKDDTLDVYVQTKLDGDNYVDIAHFAQCVACVPVSRVTAGNTVNAGAVEVQLLDIPSVATGGTFTLSFGGETTGSIDWNAAYSDIDTALEALTVIGTGGIAVTTQATSGQFLMTWAATGGQNLITFNDYLTPTTEIANLGTKRLIAKVCPGAAETAFDNATALTAGSVRNLLSDVLRARWVIASGNNASFTFSVVASPM